MEPNTVSIWIQNIVVHVHLLSKYKNYTFTTYKNEFLQIKLIVHFLGD